MKSLTVEHLEMPCTEDDEIREDDICPVKKKVVCICPLCNKSFKKNILVQDASINSIKKYCKSCLAKVRKYGYEDSDDDFYDVSPEDDTYRITENESVFDKYGVDYLDLKSVPWSISERFKYY